MSTDRTINCHVCNKYIGTIRDAKLMKGIAHVCPACLDNLTHPKKSKNIFGDSPFGDTFTDIFGDSDWLFPKK